MYVINRSETEAMDTTITLDCDHFAGPVRTLVVNGPNIKAVDTFANPRQVGVSEMAATAERQTTFNYTFEPHSVTDLVLALQ
jgi:alpha-L-arabinofuranosidase